VALVGELGFERRWEIIIFLWNSSLKKGDSLTLWINPAYFLSGYSRRLAKIIRPISFESL